ncbi:MAG: hypothetical protein A3K22_01045 [Deltaproteobacteria bacterium RBG_16_42_7]|nr:MAG: hypothetical protein A3K22_01045 [Deltaproteobacteria bacterium RBG_16_42_7]
MQLLEAKNLIYMAGDKTILNDLSITIDEAEVHALLGANGTGKSTLAYIIMGCEGYSPSSGEVLFEGKVINALIMGHDVAKKPVEVKKSIGVVPEISNLYPELTFERMTGAMERLMLYPISTLTILTGKIAGGAVFGITVTAVLLSGLFFVFPFTIVNPLLFLASALPPALRPVAYAMPLTYSVDILKVSFGYTAEILPPVASLAVLFAFTVVFLALSVKIMKGRTE